MLNSNAEVKMRKKRKWSVFTIVVFAIFVLYSLSLIGSFFWVFLSSLKDKYEYRTNVLALPQDWLFVNYINAFKMMEVNDTSFLGMTFNSIWLAVLRPTINLLTAAIASYAMSKYNFPGKKLIMGIMITTMVIPIYGSGAATFKLYKTLNFYDNPLLLITSITGMGGSLMIIAAFDGVSTSYMEAAFIEGAGHTRIFFSIMLPQVSGLLSALWIMAFVGSWNDYMTSLTYLPSYLTLSTGLYIFQKLNERKLDVPMLFAGSLICMLPALVLFLVFQDKFINISFGGGIKG